MMLAAQARAHQAFLRAADDSPAALSANLSVRVALGIDGVRLDWIDGVRLD